MLRSTAIAYAQAIVDEMRLQYDDTKHEVFRRWQTAPNGEVFGSPNASRNFGENPLGPPASPAAPPAAVPPAAAPPPVAPPVLKAAPAGRGMAAGYDPRVHTGKLNLSPPSTPAAPAADKGLTLAGGLGGAAGALGGGYAGGEVGAALTGGSTIGRRVGNVAGGIGGAIGGHYLGNAAATMLQNYGNAPAEPPGFRQWLAHFKHMKGGHGGGPAKYDLLGMLPGLGATGSAAGAALDKVSVPDMGGPSGAAASAMRSGASDAEKLRDDATKRLGGIKTPDFDAKQSPGFSNMKLPGTLPPKFRAGGISPVAPFGSGQDKISSNQNDGGSPVHYDMLPALTGALIKGGEGLGNAAKGVGNWFAQGANTPGSAAMKGSVAGSAANAAEIPDLGGPAGAAAKAMRGSGAPPVPALPGTPGGPEAEQNYDNSPAEPPGFRDWLAHFKHMKKGGPAKYDADQLTTGGGAGISLNG